MKKYLAIFKIRFQNSMQYRTAALAGMATQFAWGGMELLAFYAFYAEHPAAFPMEFSQTVAYIVLQQAFLALFMMWFFENEVFSAITSGAIAYELVRPVDLYNRWFTQSIANRVARAGLRCLPVIVVAFLLPAPFRMPLPPNLSQLLLFLLSMVLALGVVAAWGMLLYISTLYTLSPLGSRMIFAVLSDFLAGAIVPLPFFPEPFRRVAEMLPFAAMQNLPLRVYSGNLAGAAVTSGIALQVFWLVTLIALGKLWMGHALRRVTVQGG